MSADLIPLLHQVLLASQQVVAHGRAQAGMTSSEYSALHHLAYQREGLTPGQLASRLVVTTGSVTKIIDRLEARRLARRVRLPHGDRRSLTVVATSKGIALIGRDIDALLAHLPIGSDPATAHADERVLITRLLTLPNARADGRAPG